MQASCQRWCSYVGGEVLWDRVLELIWGIWNEGEVVANQKDADVIPIPKKVICSTVTTGVASIY